MKYGKKTASKWIVGSNRNFELSARQMWNVHHDLMRKLNCYDEFICSWFYERNKYGGLEIVCAGNYY